MPEKVLIRFQCDDCQPEDDKNPCAIEVLWISSDTKHMTHPMACPFVLGDTATWVRVSTEEENKAEKKRLVGRMISVLKKVELQKETWWE